MYQESHHVKHSTNDFTKYHHLSATLLFGGCAVESFLNAGLRSFLKDTVDENSIFKRLRYTSLKEKLEKWPREISNTDIEDKVISVITNFLDLRNEVTHRKRKDHSLYDELDFTDPTKFVEAVCEAFLTVYSAKGEAFPYWLLGWNFVGFNFDSTHPCIINNQQFKFALVAMGFSVPAADYYQANAWDEKFMKSVEGFRYLKKEIYDQAPDIEPISEAFPEKPRLCKKWWDKELIKNTQPGSPYNSGQSLRD